MIVTPDQIEMGDATGLCMLCGKPSTAIWAGDCGKVEVCHECIQRVLPKLAADAMPVCRTPEAHYFWHSMTTAYWEAATHRLERERGTHAGN